MSRKLLYSADVAHAVRWAVERVAACGWIVIVCPDGSEFHQAFTACAGGIFPAGAGFSGRTAVLAGGGKVSIVPVSSTPFIGVAPYDVKFCGWGDDDAADARRMQIWRAAARKVLV